MDHEHSYDHITDYQSIGLDLGRILFTENCTGGDNHQYCYRASDKLQQVVVAQRSRLIIIQILRFLSEILRRKADSAATLVAGAAADDYKLGLAQDCLSCQYIEFYTPFKSYKRIDRYDVPLCH